MDVPDSLHSRADSRASTSDEVSEARPAPRFAGPLTAQERALEWLETSVNGDFALGTVDRKLRRRYHSLLTVREPGHGDAWNVLSEVHEEVKLLESGETVRLADIGLGADANALVGFSPLPFATHHYRALGLEIDRRVHLGDPASNQVELRYRIRGLSEPVELSLEPVLACRSVHDLTFENPFLDGSFERVGDDLRMVPYAGMPAIAFRIDGIDRRRGAEGRFIHAGRWITDVHYEWEEERGYEARENLFCPGRFVVKLPHVPEVELSFVIGLAPLAERATTPSSIAPPPESVTLGDQLERAAKQFLVETRSGREVVIAGYPWFGAWSRDALIALPGLYLATRDFERVAAVLEDLWSARVRGLIPNIPAVGEFPADTSSIDASLLFVRTVQWLGSEVGEERVERFMPAVCSLLEAIADVRDPRMHFDRGVGVWMQSGPWALTWMDALIQGQPVTPRAGYAVEIDALAYNAVRFAVEWAKRRGGAHTFFARAFKTRLRTAEADFLRRYWDDERGYLADGHDGVRADTKLRPNQLFALALPYRLVAPPIARACLEAVQRTLVVPAGLRTLAPEHPSYRGVYRGDVETRDRAYHQGTVWPWLVGVYADAVLATLGRDELARRLRPLHAFFAEHLARQGCIGQVSEVFSGDAPHMPGGTPAQAWSVAELLRTVHLVRAREIARGAGSFSLHDLRS